MSKLDLLEARTEKCQFGEIQEFPHLLVPRNLSQNVLKKDLKNGADVFKQCIDMVKNPTKVTIVDCDYVDEGLMAAEYIISASNDNSYVPKLGESSFEDDPFDMSYDLNRDFVTVPILSVSQNADLIMHFSYESDGFTFNNLSCERDYMCIIMDSKSIDMSTVQKLIECYFYPYFIFLIVCDKQYEYANSCENGGIAQCILELRLETRAKVINVKHTSTEEMLCYQEQLFKNWVAKETLVLDDNFPTRKLITALQKMKSRNPHKLIGQVVQYVSAMLSDDERKIGLENFQFLTPVCGEFTDDTTEAL